MRYPLNAYRIYERTRMERIQLSDDLLQEYIDCGGCVSDEHCKELHELDNALGDQWLRRIDIRERDARNRRKRKRLM